MNGKWAGGQFLGLCIPPDCSQLPRCLTHAAPLHRLATHHLVTLKY